MMEKHRCIGETHPPGIRFGIQCSKNAKVEREGKWYCGTHDPVAVKQKREARDLEWREKYAAERSEEQEKRNAKAEIERRAGCFDDLLSALQEAVDGMGGSYYTWSDKARAAIKKATGAE